VLQREFVNVLSLNKYSWSLFLESQEARPLLRLEPFRCTNEKNLKAYNNWLKLQGNELPDGRQ